VFYAFAAEIFGMRRSWHKWHRFVFSHCLLARDFPYPEKCGSVAKEAESPLMDFAVKVPPPLCTIMCIIDGQVKPAVQSNLLLCHFFQPNLLKAF